MKPVRAITFDFWSTLFRIANSPPRQKIRIDALTDATGTSHGRAADALREVSRVFMRHHIEEQRTLQPHDAVRVAGDFLGVPVPPEKVDSVAEAFGTAILMHSPVPIDGALDAVRAAAEHVPVGLVSDTGLSPGSSLKELLRRNGFLEYFKVLVFSDEVGVAKPQRPMFETAARAMGVAPSELFHLGDLEITDIAGARNVGASAALFAGENAHYLGNTVADHTFTAWPDFTRALPQLLDSPRPG
jgi:putative hydrolase of the HAD superfamily